MHVTIEGLEFREASVVAGMPVSCRVGLLGGEWSPPTPPYDVLRAHVLILFGERRGDGFEYYTFEYEGEEYVWSYLVFGEAITEGHEAEFTVYSYAPAIEGEMDAHVVVIAGDLPVEQHCVTSEVEGSSRHVVGVRKAVAEDWLKLEELVYGDAAFENVLAVVPAGQPPEDIPSILLPRIVGGSLLPRLECLVATRGLMRAPETPSAPRIPKPSTRDLLLCLVPRLRKMMLPPLPPPPVEADVEVKGVIFEPLELDELSSCSEVRVRVLYKNNNLNADEPLSLLIFPGELVDDTFEAYYFDYDGETFVWCMRNADVTAERGHEGRSGWTQTYMVPLTDEELVVDLYVLTVSEYDLHKLTREEDFFEVDWGRGAYPVAISETALDKLTQHINVFGVDVLRAMCTIMPSEKECPLLRA